MERLTCLRCGYVYDEAKGAPSHRIAPNIEVLKKTGCAWHKNIDETAPVVGAPPGTRWEDVPAEFVCPSCGAAKELFE